MGDQEVLGPDLVLGEAEGKRGGSGVGVAEEVQQGGHVQLLAAIPPEALTEVENDLGADRAQVPDKRVDVRAQRHKGSPMSQGLERFFRRTGFGFRPFFGDAVPGFSLPQFRGNTVKTYSDVHRVLRGQIQPFAGGIHHTQNHPIVGQPGSPRRFGKAAVLLRAGQNSGQGVELDDVR